MARQRLISPQFFMDADLYDAEVSSGLPIRLAFAGLWTQADRRGLFAWKPRELKLGILPHDDVSMSDTMRALCRHGFIEYYEVDGKPYGRIRTFSKWQTFHVKERPDLRIPEPLTQSPPHNNPPEHGASMVPTLGKHGDSTPGTGTGTGTIAGTGTDVRKPTVSCAAVADAPPLALVPESPKPKKPAAEKKAPSFPHFPKSLSDEMHALWVSKFGAVDVGRFRKEFGPLFTVPEHLRGDAPTNAELFAALKSYVNLAPMGDAARFVSVVSAARCLAAIAIARKDHADDPAVRNDAIMRILHGRRVAS